MSNNFDSRTCQVSDLPYLPDFDAMLMYRTVTSPHGNGTSDAKELDTIKVVLLQDQPGVSEKELKGEAKPLHIGWADLSKILEQEYLI